MATRKWDEIYKIILNDIKNGTYKPGQELPSAEHLAFSYGVARSTIQKAFNKLATDGFIITLFEHFDRKRIVMPEIKPSLRTAGFRDDNKDNHTAFVESLELDILLDPPESIKNELGETVLYHLTRQWRSHIPVAISSSYISSIVPLKKLQSMLTEGKELYASLKILGFSPSTCYETLVAKMASEDDMKYLYGPPVIVADIVRKVYDAHDNLLEVCYLTDRADSYIFSYKFSL